MHSVLKEQWIRAKYERKEFVNASNSEAVYSKGFMEGYLWKRAKKDAKFQRRKFLLTQEEGTFVLMYYNKTVSLTGLPVYRAFKICTRRRKASPKLSSRSTRST